MSWIHTTGYVANSARNDSTYFARFYSLRDRINVEGEGGVVAEIILATTIFLAPLYSRDDVRNTTDLLKNSPEIEISTGRSLSPTSI